MIIIMNLPFNTYTKYLRKNFQGRVQKITVDAGFTCPNRDGTKGIGGCSYCNNDSFAPTHLNKIGILDQINHGIETSKRRYRKIDRYFVYFQSFSNTYASLNHLKKLYEEALSHPKIEGICIGTRPDCIDDDKLDYLESLAQKYDVTIEYGLESISDETLLKINRGHDYQSFVNAVLATTKRKNIKICTHIIIGFPWETEKLWLETAQTLSLLPINFLKIHQLHIVKGSILGSEFIKRPFKTLDKNNYISILIKFLERLRSDIVIQRIYGNAPKELLLSEEWDVEVSTFTEDVIKKMNQLRTYQGRLYNHLHH